MSKLRRKFGKRMKYNYKRTFFALFLFLIVLGFGVGYAYLSTNLSIDGTSHVKSAKWDVHFENVQISDESVPATQEPTISNDTTVNFGVTLSSPGDVYEFTADLVNEGTLNAKLGSIEILPVLTTEQQNYFNYTVTYSGDSAINENDALDAGSTETIKVRVEYLEQENADVYPSEDDNIEFSVTMNYEQGKGNDILKYVYVVSDTQVVIGSEIPENVPVRSTPALAMKDWAGVTGVADEIHPFFLRHNLKNGVIKDSNIGLEITNEFANNNPGVNAGTYYLSWTNDSSLIDEVFQNNVNVLQAAFGSSNCNLTSDKITCTASSLTAFADDTVVRVYDGDRRCYIRTGGNTKCLIFQ